MKPFILSLLKCNNCDFTSDLELSAGKIRKLEDIQMPISAMVKKKEYFLDDNAKILRSVARTIDKCECEHFTLTEEVIDEMVEGKDDHTDELANFLFGNLIEEGHIKCSRCGRRFPIKDGIVDFIDYEE